MYLLDIELIHSFAFYLSSSYYEIIDFLNSILLFSLTLSIVVNVSVVNFKSLDCHHYFCFMKLNLFNFVVHHFYLFKSAIISLNFHFISKVHFENFLYYS